jgi:hypothetical protein
VWRSVAPGQAKPNRSDTQPKFPWSCDLILNARLCDTERHTPRFDWLVTPSHAPVPPLLSPKPLLDLHTLTHTHYTILNAHNTCPKFSPLEANLDVATVCALVVSRSVFILQSESEQVIYHEYTCVASNLQGEFRERKKKSLYCKIWNVFFFSIRLFDKVKRKSEVNSNQGLIILRVQLAMHE